MTNFSKTAFETKWIAVKNLSIIWASAQRAFNEAWAKEISDNFDPDIFDELIVTLPNGNGIYHIVDGQHRKAAVQSLYGDEEKVPCRVVDASDPARAAAIFDRCNTSRKRPMPIDMFKVRVTAGCETEVAVNRIVRAAGYKISAGTRDGNVGAVQALVSVYKSFSPDTLKHTLEIIQAAWGLDKNAVVSPVIRGVGAFMAEYGHKANWQRVSDRLGKQYTPGRLLGASKTAREMLRCSTSDAVKQVVVNTYNHGLKTGQL
jgi:hypothetical protein